MYKEELERLILKGGEFSFSNNSKIEKYGRFTQVSDDFLGWLANTESFILDNYGENCGPYKLLNKIDQRKFNGFGKDEFVAQKRIILGALKACKTIPRKEIQMITNPVIELLKSKTYWTVLMVFISGSFGLGMYFEGSKFDKEKLDLYEENRQLKIYKIELVDSIKVYQSNTIK